MIQLDQFHGYPIRYSLVPCGWCKGMQWEFPFAHFSETCYICARCGEARWDWDDTEKLTEDSKIKLLIAEKQLRDRREREIQCLK